MWKQTRVRLRQGYGVTGYRMQRWVLGWRLTDALQLDARFDTPRPVDALPFCIRVIRGIRG
jgi:hypothetical protein